MARESAEGQAIELGWRRDNVMELEDEDYLAMVLKKTSWLAVIHPMRVGALIGTRGRTDLDRFIRFGFFLGAAFQIQDDLLNLARRPPLRQGGARRPLRGQAHADADPRVPPGHSGGARQAEDGPGSAPQRAAGSRTSHGSERLMERYGSLDYAREIGHGLAGAALHEFAGIFGRLPASRDKDFLRGLVTWIFERT